MSQALAMSHVSQFAPTDLGGCVLWLRAGLMTEVASGKVLSISDLSGHGVSYVQAISGKRPAYMTDLAVPSLAFDGVSTYLPTWATWHAASDYTIACVMKMVATGSDVMDNNQSSRLILSDSGYYYSGGSWHGSGDGGDTHTKILVWSLQSPNGACVYHNGTAIASGQPYTQAQLGNGVLGATYTANDGFINGRLFELVVYDRVLSSTERGLLTTKLGARYGISVA